MDVFIEMVIKMCEICMIFQSFFVQKTDMLKFSRRLHWLMLNKIEEHQWYSI